MEAISKGKQVLSDIEQSIQNALARFQSSDLDVCADPLRGIDDPIVSLHDPKFQEPKQYTTQISVGAESPTSNSSSLSRFIEQNNNEPPQSTFYTSPRVMNLSEESIMLPFLENPLQSTIEEMQRVLNVQGENFIERREISPEELLNLYSEDLGICLSNNVSPRGGHAVEKYHLSENRPLDKRSDKKIIKKSKQPKVKLNQEGVKKGENKNKRTKSEVLSSQENKLKELMNIYGCADKIKNPHSDSTLGSNSGVSRKASSKVLKQLNDSSKTSSIAPSRKSKRKNKKLINRSDLDFYYEDVPLDVPLMEKSSRPSTKRKPKQKLTAGSEKIPKKPKLKRKLSKNLGLYNDEFKLTKSGLNYKNDSYKKGNKSVDVFTRETSYKQQGSSKNNSNLQQNSIFNHRGKLKNAADSSNAKNINPNATKLSKPTKDVQVKNKHYYPETQNFKNNTILKKQTQNEMECGQTNDDHIEMYGQTVEAKVSRHVLFNADEGHGLNFTENQFDKNHQSLYDPLNEFSGHQTQLHYALPTQSSRSKEVERFLSAHYQNLPFVIGQSTNKSHNLWVNIQEALSLIKQKVPQTSETTSVAPDTVVEHDIAPSIISRLTAKSMKKPHQCPAVISDKLYDIPETASEVEEGAVGNSWEDHPECMKANLDPNYTRSRCSCLSQPSLSYKKVLQQIFGGNAMSEVSSDFNIGKENFLQDQSGDSYSAELRKALISFTQEFEDMNNKYEEMLLDPKASKEELKRLETQLEHKEEEIREIIARFNEVKELNEKIRLENHKSQAGLYPLESYKSTTSIRLAQTLHRVQKFKESLKSRPSMSYLINKNIPAISSC